MSKRLFMFLRMPLLSVVELIFLLEKGYLELIQKVERQLFPSSRHLYFYQVFFYFEPFIHFSQHMVFRQMTLIYATQHMLYIYILQFGIQTNLLLLLILLAHAPLSNFPYFGFMKLQTSELIYTYSLHLRILTLALQKSSSGNWHQKTNAH